MRREYCGGIERAGNGKTNRSMCCTNVHEKRGPEETKRLTILYAYRKTKTGTGCDEEPAEASSRESFQLPPHTTSARQVYRRTARAVSSASGKLPPALCSYFLRPGDPRHLFPASRGPQAPIARTTAANGVVWRSPFSSGVHPDCRSRRQSVETTSEVATLSATKSYDRGIGGDGDVCRGGKLSRMES